MIELKLQHQHDHQDKRQQNTHHHQEQCDSEPQEPSLDDHVPCHPHRPVAKFDFTAIQEQIRLIRLRKQAAREAALRARKVQKSQHQIYESDVIDEVLEQSMELVPSHISVAIKQRMKFMEDKVYISAQNESFGNLVARIKQEVLGNEALANELNLVMAEVQCNIQADIQEGQYQIHKIVRKQKIIPIEEEPVHRVKLKNMLIKNKLVDLREQINKSELAGDESLISASIDTSRAPRRQGQIWGDQFHLLSEGTKKAQQFVRRIRKQQLQLKKQRIKKSKQMKSLEVKSAMEHQQFQQQIKKQRHQTLKKRYIDGREERKAQLAQKQEKQKQFLNFLKEFRQKKPLFKIKEEQYLHNVVEQQNKKRQLQLEEIHNLKKSMNREDFIEHQQNYKRLKEEKLAQQAAQRQMRRKEEESRPRRSFYRGKFHSLIKLQEEQKKKIVDPNITRDQLLKKQKEFGEFVRKKYAPHISEAKRKQLDEMIASLQKNARKGLSEEDYKKLGNQYLKQMHKMIDELRSKGLIRATVDTEELPKKKDYLREVRERYNFSTIDYSSQVDANQLWVKNKAIKCEIDARNKEKVLRLKDDFDIEQYMRQLQEINDNYINSAEAKISLINKLEGRSPIRTAKQSLQSSKHQLQESSKNQSEYDY